MHYLKFEGITKLFIKVGSNNLIKILFIQTKVNGIPYKMNILFVCLVTMLAFSHYIFIACLIFRCDSIVSLLFFCTQNECKSLKRHYQCQQKFAFNYAFYGYHLRWAFKSGSRDLLFSFSYTCRKDVYLILKLLCVLILYNPNRNIVFI